MKITGNPYHMGSFCAKQKDSDKDKNPISKLGEREKLFAATAVAGFGVGVRALFFIWENGFEIGDLFKFGKKLVDKNKKGPKSPLMYLGGGLAVTMAFVGGIAALYTIFKTPEVLYDGKVNAFKKDKDMDVYSKGNAVEKELYDQLNDKAKDSTAEEKEVLKQQYLKLKAAKNQTPDFIQSSGK